jgi:hypothetical protein
MHACMHACITENHAGHGGHMAHTVRIVRALRRRFSSVLLCEIGWEVRGVSVQRGRRYVLVSIHQCICVCVYIYIYTMYICTCIYTRAKIHTHRHVLEVIVQIAQRPRALLFSGHRLTISRWTNLHEPPMFWEISSPRTWVMKGALLAISWHACNPNADRRTDKIADKQMDYMKDGRMTLRTDRWATSQTDGRTLFELCVWKCHACKVIKHCDIPSSSMSRALAPSSSPSSAAHRNVSQSSQVCVTIVTGVCHNRHRYVSQSS